MNILLLGASGKTGRQVLDQALAAGNNVTAFVRDPKKLDRDDVAVAIGDARNVDDLRKALRGQDAVISTLGTGLNASEKLIEGSTEALLDAMHSTGVKRLVMLSTFAASPDLQSHGHHEAGQDRYEGHRRRQDRRRDAPQALRPRLDDRLRQPPHRWPPHERLSDGGRNPDRRRHDQPRRSCRRSPLDALR